MQFGCEPISDIAIISSFICRKNSSTGWRPVEYTEPVVVYLYIFWFSLCIFLDCFIYILAKYYNVLQHIATHCHAMSHTVTHCNTLQHIATHCNALQHTATHCNTLQHTATHCNTLHYTATHCNTHEIDKKNTSKSDTFDGNGTSLKCAAKNSTKLPCR